MGKFVSCLWMAGYCGSLIGFLQRSGCCALKNLGTCVHNLSWCVCPQASADKHIVYGSLWVKIHSGEHKIGVRCSKDVHPHTSDPSPCSDSSPAPSFTIPSKCRSEVSTFNSGQSVQGWGRRGDQPGGGKTCICFKDPQKKRKKNKTSSEWPRKNADSSQKSKPEDCDVPQHFGSKIPKLLINQGRSQLHLLAGSIPIPTWKAESSSFGRPLVAEFLV